MAHLKMRVAQIKYAPFWGGPNKYFETETLRERGAVFAEMGLSSERPLYARAFLHKIKSRRMFYDIIYGGARAPDLWYHPIQVNEIITFR